MKKLHFISGIPRSGSTLLCNLLNMNDAFHATATSPILEVLNGIRHTYSHNVVYKTNNRLEQYEYMRLGMKGFLEGFYSGKGVVFDKCRGWVNNLPLIDDIMGHKETKIIWTYRNPVEVVSTMESQHIKTILLQNADELCGVDFSTVHARVDNYIRDNGILAKPIWNLHDAYGMGYNDRIMIIKFNELTINPQGTLDSIHDFLGEDRYQYDTNNFSDLKQSTFEFDGIFNYKYRHDIKEGLVRHSPHNINLPEHAINAINNKFGWITNLVGDI
jgi:sulfotransferase